MVVVSEVAEEDFEGDLADVAVVEDGVEEAVMMTGIEIETITTTVVGVIIVTMCGSLGEATIIILVGGAGVMRHHSNQLNILAALLTPASRLSLKHRRSQADIHPNRRSQRLVRLV